MVNLDILEPDINSNFLLEKNKNFIRAKRNFEAAKRKISMKKLVHDAISEYLERHEEAWHGLTPEILEKIKVCAVKVFEPKNVKTKWIRNLIKIVVKKSELSEHMVEAGIKKLIDYGLLIKDYKDEVSYCPDFEESLEILNSIGKE